MVHVIFNVYINSLNSYNNSMMDIFTLILYIL
jgi:hypothetical protein